MVAAVKPRPRPVKIIAIDQLGACSQCPEPRTNPRYKLCDGCRIGLRVANQTYRQAKPPGECRECKADAKPGRKRCADHLKYDAQRCKLAKRKRVAEEKILRAHGLDPRELDAFA